MSSYRSTPNLSLGATADKQPDFHTRNLLFRPSTRPLLVAFFRERGLSALCLFPSAQKENVPRPRFLPLKQGNRVVAPGITIRILCYVYLLLVYSVL